MVHLYFGPQLEINSTAGRPSGWALPHILVDQDLVVNFATYMRVYTVSQKFVTPMADPNPLLEPVAGGVFFFSTVVW